MYVLCILSIRRYPTLEWREILAAINFKLLQTELPERCKSISGKTKHIALRFIISMRISTYTYMYLIYEFWLPVASKQHMIKSRFLTQIYTTTQCIHLIFLTSQAITTSVFPFSLISFEGNFVATCKQQLPSMLTN